MAKIEAPNKEYNGPGPGGATFKDGVAETDDPAALNYYLAAGYTVGRRKPAGQPDEAEVDSREIGTVMVGNRLRDAAVDPQEGDFLAPINAGQSDPHGPEVISPEIHGSGPAGILPGVVPADDLGKQDQREREFVDQRILQKRSIIDAAGVDVDQRGPLGLSDPASVEAGQVDDAQDQSDEGDAQVPAHSANKPEWVDWAVSQGADRSEAEALTKAELIDQYGIN